MGNKVRSNGHHRYILSAACLTFFSHFFLLLLLLKPDPISLVDYNNINLSWKGTDIDEITKEEYVVYYEKGDIVITNGIEAEVEAQRHVHQEFMKNRHRNKATEDNRDTAFGGKTNQPRTAKKHSKNKSINGKMETSSLLLPASSPSIRRIFVATCSNTNSHPMATGSANKWKEITLYKKSRI